MRLKALKVPKMNSPARLATSGVLYHAENTSSINTWALHVPAQISHKRIACILEPQYPASSNPCPLIPDPFIS
ncbi:hypothetical protein EYC80_007671 [Monilinia laxa]|uniref:Uncharacterized protein n=1 Tax=Monilinia laxa TaxID=61186 RepID=A0A5N6JWM3_MONLA|nr:hypothetical protein EYC80_007671 [Monilinia laxa]